MALPPGLWLNFEDGPAQLGGFRRRGQISGVGATLSERSCCRPKYLQPPAPSRLPVDASDLPIRSGGAMAQRDERGMTTVRPPVF
jgi:hypothetical protein